MFSSKKVILMMWRKFWRMFSSKNAQDVLDPQVLAGMHTLQVFVSTRAYESYLPNVQVVVLGEKKLTASMGIKNQEGRWDLWQDTEWYAGQFGPARPKMFAPLWLFTHVAVRESFNPYKEMSLQPVSGQTTDGLQKESQGLQWLQTSFRVLNSALESCQRNHDQMVVATFNMGPEGCTSGASIWISQWSLDQRDI